MSGEEEEEEGCVVRAARILASEGERRVGSGRERGGGFREDESGFVVGEEKSGKRGSTSGRGLAMACQAFFCSFSLEMSQ